MDIILTIIAVIVIFSALVLVHEYGHFLAARRAGIKVLEFGIGFPPRLFKKKMGETTYSINAIPFGGFVKLYGEDSSDPAILKDPRSFAHQSKWVRTKVIAAGVFMNFVLAIVLLTIGFIFGIDPLIVNQDDLFKNIDNGIVVTSPGAFVQTIDEKQKASGIMPGDQVLAINDVPVDELNQLTVFDKNGAEKDVDLTIRSQDKSEKKIHVPLLPGKKSLGISLKSYTELPRVTVLEVKNLSAADKAGLKKGDTILTANGKQVYDITVLQDLLVDANFIKLSVLRDRQLLDLTVNFSDNHRIVISDVFSGTLAAQLGFKKGDVLKAVNNQPVVVLSDIKKIADTRGTEATFQVDRDGKQIELKGTVEQGKMLGISVSQSLSYKNADISMYRDFVLTSVTQMNKVRMGPWSAFKEALSESVRLTELTFTTIVKTFGSIFSTLKVPTGVGGPVQIAYYTHTFVQEGFFALLRFSALLSLSLAVMNVLPIPALDGGRLFFILVETVTRRRVSARFEAIVHTIGFFLLIGLIFLITYSDITKLF
ncbi:site-2 protease family protein [Candidatus Gracilibacteria bacterium]|nr:site-2 protease family protein [Candidatus Gracilibacteria bacterium]